MSKDDYAKEDQTRTSVSESIEEEYSSPWPKQRLGYTRRLIRIIRIPADEIDENFDEDTWNKKVYGPDIIVVDMLSVPKGWILVDGIAPSWNAH